MDMILSKTKKASLLAGVKHLEMMKNDVIKVGFEITYMDELSSKNYNNFLEFVDTA